MKETVVTPNGEITVEIALSNQDVKAVYDVFAEMAPQFGSADDEKARQQFLGVIQDRLRLAKQGELLQAVAGETIKKYGADIQAEIEKNNANGGEIIRKGVNHEESKKVVSPAEAEFNRMRGQQ